MILTNPKKPIITGITLTLVISSLVVGSYYLYPYLNRVFNNTDLVAEVQLPENIKNSFGTYELPELNYTPSIIPTPIQAGLANVNLQGLDDELNSEIIKQLKDNGFALVDSGLEDIFEPMYYDSNLHTPMYISTDFCLHILHSMFDNSLRIIELEYFFSEYSLMLNALRESQIYLYSLTTDSEVKEAVKNNIAYLTVSMYLLDDKTSIPIYVNSLVNQELNNIELGIGSYSSIFDYREDFSQYKPRGHYTQNIVLEQYFQAMMYSGRMGFVLDDQSADNLVGIQQTRMALALVFSFSAEIGEKTVWDYWDNICGTTNFLVGNSDDLTPIDYFEVWEDEGEISFLDLSEDAFIEEKIETLKELRAPKINSGYVVVFEGEEDASKGFRLFGQGYTPDAYIFQELVTDNIPDRYFPQPLDIFSVFGSERAEYHLRSELVYEGYEEKIFELRSEFENISITDWTQNIYWQWLFSIQPLLAEKGYGYPEFMQSNSWLDKSLMTALASWVELKHDTILYAKQAYSAYGLGPGIFHYVEPYPKVYSRIGTTLKMLKEGLETRGMLYSAGDLGDDYYQQYYGNFTLKFDELIEIFDRLTVISIKELENQELSSEDLSFIHHLGKRLQLITSFNYGNENWYDVNADKRTALIADVFTDPNSGQVLEVAVGNPLLIYVIVQNQTGHLHLTRGVTFSYYDFKQPSSNRLTDEEWQEMLDSSPPELPEWISKNLHIIEVETVMMLKVQAFSNGVNKVKVKEEIIEIIILS
ncbi:MAG: DUF3160 domain-containing protein [Candidatus Heimdallarchaeota archaeon]|nr:DUF3160 domain-containing protein [Candidatus Heimdallarchaeota archaeon]